MNGTTNSFSVIMPPETEAVTARGMLSDMIIKPFVVARSVPVTNSICKVVLMGPAMFISAVLMIKDDAAKVRFGERVISMMNGIEKY